MNFAAFGFTLNHCCDSVLSHDLSSLVMTNGHKGTVGVAPRSQGKSRWACRDNLNPETIASTSSRIVDSSRGHLG
jgi:hypothetical protein